MLDKDHRRKLLIMDAAVYFAALAIALFIRYRYIVTKVMDIFVINNGGYVLFVTASVVSIMLTYLYYVAHDNYGLSGDVITRAGMVLKNHFFFLAISSIFLMANQKILDVSRFVIMIMYPVSIVLDFVLRELYRSHLKRTGFFTRKKKPYILVSEKRFKDEVSHRLSEGSDGISSIVAFVDIDDDKAVIPKAESVPEDTAVLVYAPGRDVTDIRSLCADAGYGVYECIFTDGAEVHTGNISDAGPYKCVCTALHSKHTASVFGVPFRACTQDDAVLQIRNNVKALSGKYVCFSNVHTTVMAADDAGYREVLCGADYVFPDGAPIADRLKKAGFGNVERVAGPDFMRRMFLLTSDGSVSHYFFGSTEETLKALEEKMKKDYPGLSVKGYFSPPFKELAEEEDEKIIKMLNEADADIIWVGLGAPKQERWMAAHKDKVKGVMMGVGAGFDFHAGTVKRAPSFMQRIHLEWLFRLFQDPKRLFSRYFKTNIKFALYSFLGK